MFETYYIPRSLGVQTRDRQFILSYKDWPISKISMGESGTTSTSQCLPTPHDESGWIPIE